MRTNESQKKGTGTLEAPKPKVYSEAELNTICGELKKVYHVFTYEALRDFLLQMSTASVSYYQQCGHTNLDEYPLLAETLIKLFTKVSPIICDDHEIIC